MDFDRDYVLYEGDSEFPESAGRTLSEFLELLLEYGSRDYAISDAYRSIIFPSMSEDSSLFEVFRSLSGCTSMKWIEAPIESDTESRFRGAMVIKKDRNLLTSIRSMAWTVRADMVPSAMMLEESFGDIIFGREPVPLEPRRVFFRKEDVLPYLEKVRTQYEMVIM